MMSSELLTGTHESGRPYFIFPLCNACGTGFDPYNQHEIVSDSKCSECKKNKALTMHEKKCMRFNCRVCRRMNTTRSFARGVTRKK